MTDAQVWPLIGVFTKIDHLDRDTHGVVRCVFPEES